MNKTMDPHFEAWARKMSMDLEYRNIPGVGKFYECPRTLLAFEAWQASRADIEVEFPEQRNVPDRDCWARTNALGYNMANHECRTAIESLGLKVKP